MLVGAVQDPGPGHVKHTLYLVQAIEGTYVEERVGLHSAPYRSLHGGHRRGPLVFWETHTAPFLSLGRRDSLAPMCVLPLHSASPHGEQQAPPYEVAL
jgi:hypothetical protein